jgi:peptide/nickel transport system permease protein
MENLSPNQKAFNRLKKNKPALLGIGLIIFSVIIAIFGYTISPDSTPNANNQMPTIALKNPGFEAKILKVQKNRETVEHSILSRLFLGAENEFEMIPIDSFQIVGDSVFFSKYKGDNVHSVVLKEKIHLADIAYNIPFEDIKSLVKKEGFYCFGDKKYDITQTKALVELQIKTQKFYLGTDNYGRDNLSRLIIGVRISLLVGLIAVVISLTIGVLLGALAGYFGGRVDDIIMLIINTIWSIPTILLIFAIVLAFGKSVGIIFLAVGLTMWVDVARLVRGQVLSLKEISFVEAAQSMGFSTGRILMRHILPNILGPVMVVAASNFATAILIESGLSYLGFGIQPPTPSWGTMLNENYGYAIGGKPFLALVPAVAIMVMVLAFNLVGNGFRDALDVKSKE